MTKGPNGQRRPADVVGCAVTVAKIATGEMVEKCAEPSGRKKSGKAGGRARAKKLSKEERVEIARKAANARWN